MPRGRMGCVGRSLVQGLMFLQSAREQICRLDGESSCLLPSLEALGWVHAFAVQLWCSGKGTVGSAGPAPVPQDEARLLLTLQMFRLLGREIGNWGAVRAGWCVLRPYFSGFIFDLRAHMYGLHMREAGLKGLLWLHNLKSAGENKIKPQDCCQVLVEDVPTYTYIYMIFI